VERRRGALLASNLLDLLREEDRARLYELGRARVVERGEEVVRQGTLGDCLFVVEEGELAVVRALPGDEERVLITARPGMLLGELAVLDGAPRSASLRAVRPSVLRVIGLGSFEALVLHGGEAGHRILRAVAMLVHDRLEATRQVAAPQAAVARAPLASGAALAWSPPHSAVAGVLGVLPAFAGLHRPDREGLLAAIRVVELARGADLVLPEAVDPGVVMVLRGALSPWLADGSGPEATLPAIGPGGFVDYAAALGIADEPRTWRVRSPTRLMRLDPALFEPAAPWSARLLYALSRDLALTLRRTTGLAMHFGMAWAREAPRPDAKRSLARAPLAS
jgi:CRP-like cAMP-binding protein